MISAFEIHQNPGKKTNQVVLIWSKILVVAETKGKQFNMDEIVLRE
jgi:hypothetical protein